jgi:hypothetical protein
MFGCYCQIPGCGGNILVPKNFFECVQIPAIHQEMRSKRVPEWHSGQAKNSTNERIQSPSWKNAIHLRVFSTSIPGPFNVLNNYFKFLTGKNQSFNWSKSISLMKISIFLSILFTFVLGLSGGCPVPDGLFYRS